MSYHLQTLIVRLRTQAIHHHLQYTPAEVDFLMENYISGLLSMYQKWFLYPNGITIERIIQLSYLTLPDTSGFENFDKELRK